MSALHGDDPAAAAAPAAGALAWVADEIRAALDAALAGARAWAADPSDAAQLRTAERQMHAAAGALHLLDLRGAALTAEAGESLLRQWAAAAPPQPAAAVDTVQAAVGALLLYLDRLLAGRNESPLRLYPYYRELLRQTGAARIHPADLLPPELAAAVPPLPQIADDAPGTELLRRRRAAYERALLRLLRDAGDTGAREELHRSIAELDRAPLRARVRTFWWVASGLTEALAAGRLTVDDDLRRVLARVNLQLARLIDGGGSVAEQLFAEALFCLGRASADEGQAAAVRRFYRLAERIPADYDEPRLTLVDAALAHDLKEALATARAEWPLVAAGQRDAVAFVQTMQRAQALAQRPAARPLLPLFEGLARHGQRYPGLAAAAQAVVAVEIAAAVLLAELGVESLTELDANFDERVRLLLARLDAAAGQQPLPPSDALLLDLVHRAADRLALGGVVGEMRGTLREVEQRLDRVFRNAAEPGDLAACLPLLDQVRGALAVLGHDEAAAAVASARRTLSDLNARATPPSAEAATRLAGNLGAVGFFVESLLQDGARAPGMFRYDPAADSFTADLTVRPQPAAAAEFAPVVARRTDRSAEEAAETWLRQSLAAARRLAEAPDDAAALDESGAALARLALEVELIDDSAWRELTTQASALYAQFERDGEAATAQALVQALAARAAPATPPPTAPLPSSQAALDRELLGTFLGEASEIVDGIDAQLPLLRADPGDRATLVAVRRSFHTLKGSSRMVGLTQFGEAAWAVEQTFNLWLAQERPAGDDLLALATGASVLMRGWLLAIGADPATELDIAALAAAAQQVRDGGPCPPLPAPATAPAPPDESQPIAERSSEDQSGRSETGPSDAGAGSGHDVELLSGSAPLPAAASGEVRRIGPIELSHALFTVFVNEADEHVRQLAQEVGEWRYEASRPPSAAALRAAHSLTGISATVGVAPVAALVEPIESLLRLLAPLTEWETELAPPGAVVVLDGPQFDVLERAVDRLRGMLHEFAAGVYPDEAPLEVAALQDLLAVIRLRGQLQREQAAPSLTAEPAPAPPTESLVEYFHEHPDSLPAARSGVELRSAPAETNTASSTVAETRSVADWLTGAQTPPPAEPLATAAGSDAATAPPTPALLVAAPPATAATAGPAFASAAAPYGSDGTAGVQPTAPPLGGQAAAASAVARLTLPTEVADDLDAELLAAFRLEAQDLLPAIGEQLRALVADPAQAAPARELMRHLHTLKGAARMAGAMRLGEVAHAMEEQIEAGQAQGAPPREALDAVLNQFDQVQALFDALERPAATPAASAESLAATATAPTATSLLGPAATVGGTFVRVRGEVLDKLVDQTGEVAIARAKLENEVGTLKSSLTDLTDNISRLRSQLREVEIQAEAQIQARSDQVSRQSADFDPLEFDRYTRLQELTRLLAESVEDVALIQGGMLKGLASADDDLTAQSRLTRELQQQLMRVRLVPFAGLAERLYRVARQTAKEVGKRVNLDLRGGSTEIDRGVLEKMAGPFEHVVRNAIVHGIEPPGVRRAAGKSEIGELTVEVRQQGNEIVVTFADDGAGLDWARIRARAEASGALPAGAPASERDLAELIFAPGFSTAETVSELAGRGVGMDVVRAGAAALGGRVTVASEHGQGARFALYLPLTLAVTQVVLATVAERRYAIPAALVEQVRRYKPEALAGLLARGAVDLPPVGTVPLRPLAQLIGQPFSFHHARQLPVLLLRAGDERLALAMDDVTTGKEVVVKNVGPQVSRLAGMLGATITGDGEVVLIVNPLQLLARAPQPPALPALPVADAPAVAAPAAPRVMVVDDSLTVRRVTQRLLERNGYEVMLAKDGVDALRQLQDRLPDAILLDIEMPRMDGFDFTRNVRADPGTRAIPIVVITSRSADKHRSLALELGADAFLGKPYPEDELLALLASYAQRRRSAS
ncbi:MAG: Hpt domain-containing protein [Betaproteobacteria bacterium]